MNLLFVLFNAVNCTLEEVETFLWQINAIQLELNGFITTCNAYFNGFLNHVEEGKESPEKEKSKEQVRQFIYEVCFPFLSSLYDCSFDYLENCQKIIGEHITKVESDEYTPEYLEELTALEVSLTNDKTSFTKCSEEFNEMKTKIDACASSEDVISEHRLLLTVLNTQSHRLYTKQLEFMEKGQTLACQIAKILKDLVDEKNEISVMMQILSLDDIQD